MADLSLKSLRTIGMYTGLALAVTVGGVAIGAMVVAPAVARAKPLLLRAIATNEPNESGDALSVNASAVPISESAVAVVAPFRPMASAIKAEAIVDAAEALASQMAPVEAQTARVTVMQVLERFASKLSRIPGNVWAFVGSCALLVAAGMFYMRRRAVAGTGVAASSTLVATGSSKLVQGKSSRTPRAVVALAESGASATDIARRTRMPLDAVAMCLSMGSLGARQLRPPTA